MYEPKNYRYEHRKYGCEILDKSKLLNFTLARGLNTYGYANQAQTVSIWVCNEGYPIFVGFNCVGEFYNNLNKEEREIFKEEYEDLKIIFTQNKVR